MTQSDIPWSMTVLRRWARGVQEPSVARLAKGRNTPYAVLLGALLSARTRDATTSKVVPALLRRAPAPEALARMDVASIASIVKPVGLYRSKARHLKELARILVRRHGGRVPRTLDDLLALPGVGLKTANLVLGQAFGVPAICVDVHVHRITNRWGLVSTRAPERTEEALRDVVPQRYWIEINPLLVRFGQRICLPRGPKCRECPLLPRCEYGVARAGETTYH